MRGWVRVHGLRVTIVLWRTQCGSPKTEPAAIGPEAISEGVGCVGPTRATPPGDATPRKVISARLVCLRGSALPAAPLLPRAGGSLPVTSRGKAGCQSGARAGHAAASPPSESRNRRGRASLFRADALTRQTAGATNRGRHRGVGIIGGAPDVGAGPLALSGSFAVLHTLRHGSSRSGSVYHSTWRPFAVTRCFLRTCGTS